jgi:hypothetical protein
MPSNHILINNSMEYSVPDSKMDKFLLWLEKNGYIINTGLQKEPDEILTETISYSQS